MTENTYVIGIDIGGTNIRIGLVNSDYELVNFVIESSKQVLGFEHPEKKLVEFIEGYINKYATDKEIRAISIGLPSTISKDRKVVLSTPNIAGLDNIPIVDELENALNIKTFLNKDVNMLILYDAYRSRIPAKGVTTGFYLGTGLGNAILINGELLIGKNGVAAELGHIPSRDHTAPCGCGNYGCVETFASGKHLAALRDEHFEDTFIGDVFKEYRETPIIKKFIRDLALPVASEINILDPDYIIIGGGLVFMEGFPFDQLEVAIREFTRKPYPEQSLEFFYSEQGQENGVVGAGINAYKEMNKIIKH